MPMSLPIFDGMDTTDRNVSSIVSAFRQDGLVCFRLLTQDECDDLILEQVSLTSHVACVVKGCGFFTI